MKSIIFEPFSGASGDMILGALIDLGASESFIRTHIESLANVSFQVRKTEKNGIAATDVQIIEKQPNNTRGFFEICEIISNSDLPNDVKENAIAIFKIIAEAESTVHGRPLETLHFHETGQDDAIADVVGACLAFFDLKSKQETEFDKIYCGEINVGGGFTKCCHGTLPVPAPATLEILKRTEFSYYSRGERELLTPTGAAILSYFASPLPDRFLRKAESVGYGAGDADTEMPNVLRVLYSEETIQIEPLRRDPIEVLETNVDDVTGEVLGYLIENLMEMGALDVAVIPMYMKKGRPAHLIKVVSKPEDSEKLARQIIKETGSLGVRVAPSRHRVSVEREIVSVDVEISGKVYAIPLKIARFPEGEIVQISAEYEVCRQISKETGIPLREIIKKAEQNGRERFKKL